MSKINGRNIVMESYDKIKKTLAIAFMHVLDANRPEGKMCLSNGECTDIEKAFNEQDWPRLAGYLDKYTESKDERTRKELMNEICCLRASESKGSDRYESLTEMLAYLEKQKEQIHLLHPKDMDYEKVLGERKFPTYEQLKNGLIRLIDEEKISREDAARLLPELRESEDERIRQFLIERIISLYGVDSVTPGGIAVNDIVLYLEKQKINTEGDFARGYDCGYECCLNSHGAEWFEKQKEIPMPNSTELIEMWHKEKAILKEKDFRGNEWRLAQNAFIDGFAKGTCVKFEKQKEQKHAPDDLQKSFEAGQTSIVDNQEQYGLCKKTEWGEEDEKMRRLLIAIMEKNPKGTVYSTGEFAQALKKGCVSVDEISGWLKSIRPSWKPSEEQMAAFSRFITYCMTQVNTGCYKQVGDIRLVEQIYEHLKNL